MSVRLTPERAAVIRQGQPTDWLSKPWTITEIEGDGETPGSWQVLHESTVIATLPDWAGNLALWMAEAPEDIQALLAELAAVRAERDLARRKVASLKAEQDRDDAEYAEVIAERDSAREALREACDQIAALESDLGGATARIAELEAERLTQNQALDDAVQELRSCRDDKPAATCRCNEPDADPYACEADDCEGEFSELNPFGGSTLPVEKASAEVSKTCGCGRRTSVWHVDDGSAEEELHRHVTRCHDGTYTQTAEEASHG